MIAVAEEGGNFAHGEAQSEQFFNPCSVAVKLTFLNGAFFLTEHPVAFWQRVLLSFAD